MTQLAHIVERRTVHHRDGTTTTWAKWEAPTTDIVYLYAMRTGWIPKSPTREVPFYIAWRVKKEQHKTRVFTKLELIDMRSDMRAEVTQTDLGRNFDLSFWKLDQDSAVFWENTDKPSVWSSLPPVPAVPKTPILDLLYDMQVPSEHRLMFGVTNEDLDKLCSVAQDTDEFEIAAACETEDEDRLKAALDDYLQRFNAPESLRDFVLDVDWCKSKQLEAIAAAIRAIELNNKDTIFTTLKYSDPDDLDRIFNDICETTKPKPL